MRCAQYILQKTWTRQIAHSVRHVPALQHRNTAAAAAAGQGLQDTSHTQNSSYATLGFTAHQVRNSLRSREHQWWYRWGGASRQGLATVEGGGRAMQSAAALQSGAARCSSDAVGGVRSAQGRGAGRLLLVVALGRVLLRRLLGVLRPVLPVLLGGIVLPWRGAVRGATCGRAFAMGAKTQQACR